MAWRCADEPGEGPQMGHLAEFGHNRLRSRGCVNRLVSIRRCSLRFLRLVTVAFE